MRLHFKSGFIIYNTFNLGIYDQTSGDKKSSLTILSLYRSWHRGIYLIKYYTSLSLTEIGQPFKDKVFLSKKTTPNRLTQNGF